MNYVLKTNRGVLFSVDSASVDIDGFFNSLNNRQLLAVSLGEIGMSKHNIISVVPDVLPESPTHNLWLNTGDKIVLGLAEGDSVRDVIARVNDHEKEFVKIGDVFFQSRMFDTIAPIETTPQ